MFWSRGLDLNQRPSGYEPDELPDCSTPHYEARVARERTIPRNTHKVNHNEKNFSLNCYDDGASLQMPSKELQGRSLQVLR